MKIKTLILLSVLASILPLLAAPPDTLLQKQPDGSVLITPENIWAITRGKIPNYEKEYMTSQRVVGLLWADQLRPITDEFAQHDLAAKYAKLLDDASAQASSINEVTFVFHEGFGQYDFTKSAFPVGHYGNDPFRLYPGAVYVTFDRTLLSQLSVPEDKAKALLDAIRADNGQAEVTVKGVLKACRPTTGAERGGAIGWQPKLAEEEPTNAPDKMIISVRSIEYRLPKSGIVLLSKTFTDEPPASTSAATPQ